MRARTVLVSVAGGLIVLACGSSTTMLGSTGDGSAEDGDGSASAVVPQGTGVDASASADDAADWCGESCWELGQYNCRRSCAPGEWCDRGKGVCMGKGTCKERPAPPPAVVCKDGFCGCDGKTYCSPEQAQSAGVAIALQGACTFVCDEKTCNAATELCEIVYPGAATVDSGTGGIASCKPFADVGCANDHTCACVTSGGGATTCTEPGGHVEVKHYLP